MILREVAEGRWDGEFWEKLKILEIEYQLYLINEERTWQLKSRDIWVEAGEKNTVFSQLCIGEEASKHNMGN